MKKILSVILLLFMCISVVSCKAEQETTPETTLGSDETKNATTLNTDEAKDETTNEVALNETTTSGVINSTTKANHSEDKSASNSDKAGETFDLLDGYWEYYIQSHAIYKFFKDGTVNEYYTAYDKEYIVPEELTIWRTLHYKWDGKVLTIEGYSWEMELVTNDADIDWDIGLWERISKIPKGEKFFYETGYDIDLQPYDNAMYLSKAKVKEN